MFGIGTSEILVVLVIALIVLGPKEIPKVAKTIGRIMNDLQRAKDELRKAIDVETEEGHLRNKTKNPKNEEIKDINELNENS